MAATDATPKASPDVTKLTNMQKRIVTVTKVRRGGASAAVVPYWDNPAVEQIMNLQAQLPVMSGAGPGVYKFDVADPTTNERESWTVQLGSDVPEMAVPSPTVAGGSSMNPGFPSVGGGVVSPDGSIQLGHGYQYNEALGILVTPQKQIFEWKPGTPLPGALGAYAAPFAPNTTMSPGAPGWGTMPAGETEADKRIRALEASLAAAESARKDEERRREMQDMRASMEKLHAESNAMFAKLLEKPTGPSPTEVQLQRELEETKRAITAQAAAAEARSREDTLRAEMKAAADRNETLIREIRESANKQPDPMLPLLGQILTGQQASSTAMMLAMKETAQIQATASKDNSDSLSSRLAGAMLTPERTVELIKLAKDQSANSEVNKGMVDMFKTTFGMAQDVIRMQADAMGSASGPPWLGIAQQAVDQVGRVATLYATRKAQGEAEAAAAERRDEVASQRALQVQQQQAAARAQAAGAQRARQQVQGPPPPPRELTAQDIRDQAAAEYNRARGVPPPSNGASAAAADPAKRKKKRQPQPAAEAPPAVATDLRKASAADVRALIEAFDDDAFFGPSLSQVEKLRDSIANEALPPDQAANAILMSRQYFAAFGEYPPVLEVLNSGHIEVLLERMLPDVDEGYRRQVADSIRVQLRTETSGGGGGDERGEDDGDGEAAA